MHEQARNQRTSFAVPEFVIYLRAGQYETIRQQRRIFDKIGAVGGKHQQRIETPARLPRDAPRVEHMHRLPHFAPVSRRDDGVLALRVDHQRRAGPCQQVRNDCGNAFTGTVRRERQQVLVGSESQQLAFAATKHHANRAEQAREFHVASTGPMCSAVGGICLVVCVMAEQERIEERCTDN